MYLKKINFINHKIGLDAFAYFQINTPLQALKANYNIKKVN